MFATVIQCDMHAIASVHERGRVGRTLATRLSTLPGFVAFLALDAEAGDVIALCIFEDRAGMEVADRTIGQWQPEYAAAAGTGLRRLGTGAVIVQKGL